MFLPKPSDSNFKPVPAGTWPAICYRVIDLGTQESTYQGERQEKRKIMVSFELHDEECLTDDGKPMTIHQRYTWSMHEKALLRRHLEAWRAKPFTPQDFGEGGFDIRKLLGVPCMLSVIHNTTNDRTFANVSAIAKLPKGISAGDLVNDKVFVSLEAKEFEPEAFGKLADWLQNTIKASPEYRRVFSNGGDQSHGNWQAPLRDQVPF